VALLDINRGGKRVDAVAEVIRARGTPVIFVTGYGRTGASGLVLGKRYDSADLARPLTRRWVRAVVKIATSLSITLVNCRQFDLTWIIGDGLWSPLADRALA
jgi:hypothetical protein